MGNLINAEFLLKDTSNMSRQEKMQHLKDLEFERLAFVNHWTEEEKKQNKAEFEAEKDRESKLIHNYCPCIKIISVIIKEYFGFVLKAVITKEIFRFVL